MTAEGGFPELEREGNDMGKVRTGLLDEIHIDLVPVLLGGGVSLFDHLGTGPIPLEVTRTIQGAGVTHLTYRVLR